MGSDDRPEARLRVENCGDELIELVIEPYGRDYWLKPGEGVLVTTVGIGGDAPWPGTTRQDEPFEVDHRHGSVTVHANGVDAYVNSADAVTSGPQ
ncbi:hypothetical protein [Catellatospora sp. TT07R-123]|uniref:hypothetical protein n=1 Tax=Catellatospora sp. TT07R-123 TaxID=2733863 RepID=UPI001BB43398|nr:hypothetical protein [Catellatospora sp. TT07R-123]